MFHYRIEYSLDCILDLLICLKVFVEIYIILAAFLIAKVYKNGCYNHYGYNDISFSLYKDHIFPSVYHLYDD